MGKEFKKALITFIGLILVLVVILVVVIQRYSIYGSIETMEMVDFQGILIAFLGAAVLNLMGILLTFNLARAWVKEQPELSERIFKFSLLISLTFIIIVGALAAGIIILRTLWTIGYF